MKKLLTSFFVLFFAISLSAQHEAIPLQVGDTVIVKQEAKRYLTGERISSWVYTVKHTIRQIGTAKWQNGILLRGIRSWLTPDDVSLVGNTPTPQAQPTPPMPQMSIAPKQSEDIDIPLVESEKQPVVEQQIEQQIEQPTSSAPVGPTRLYGRLVAQGSGTNIAGATITLANQNFSTTTNQNGEFTLLYLEPGDEELIIEADGYNSDIQLIQILASQDNELGTLYLQPDVAKDVNEEILLNLSDQDLNDDEGRTQEQASSSSSSIDVFNSTTSFAWSNARYRNRGYEQRYEQNYIEGLSFNSAERGQFNFSAMGGLNDASRYKETVNPIEANNFAFGGIGKATNYLMSASNYAQGWKVGVAGTNRNYKAAARATYSSGPLRNGWFVASQLAFRGSPYIDQKGIIGEGIQYASFGYFVTAEKQFGPSRSLSFLTFGAPTERGQSSALTQEVYTLTNQYNPNRWGWNSYNPYWGYQNGKVRNSRIVKSYDPTAIVSLKWALNDQEEIRAAVGYHYSMYSNSAITFYNAPDPRPDYYRNLPSFLYDGQINANGNFISKDANGHAFPKGFYNENGEYIGGSIDADTYNSLYEAWTSRDNTTTQIDWDALYTANYANNANNPTGCARYMVERRHNDIQEGMGTFTYRTSKYDHLTLLAGIELKQSQGIHYKTVDDLLGGNQWIDIDPFADRDIAELAENIGMAQTAIGLVRQNEVRNPDARKTGGERFGYDYRITMSTVKVWAQNEWKWQNIDLYYALQLTYSNMQRTTSMFNGRAYYQGMLNPEYAWYYLGPNYETILATDVNSVSDAMLDGYMHHFIDPAFKLGLNYRINGRNHIRFNAMAETRAPLARDAYISPRIFDRAVETIYRHDYAGYYAKLNSTNPLTEYYAASEKLVGGDLTYEFNFPIVRGRLTGFFTQIWNGTELNSYYQDEARTFVNQALTGINRRHVGGEAAVSVKIGTYFTLTGAASVGDYRYTSNAYATSSAENGMPLGTKAQGPVFVVSDSVLIKGLRVANGPQVNASLKLSFFHPKMWFADITVSYFDWNFLDYAPSRRMQGLYTGTCADGTPMNGWYGDTYCNAIQKDEQGQVVYNQYGVAQLRYPYNLLSDQESLVAGKVWDRFLIDMSVGKLIYLPNRQSLSINLTVNNITNNVNFKTGGYQQARLPRQTRQGQPDGRNSLIGSNVWKFPSKYYYAWGTNFYLNIQYKF